MSHIDFKIPSFVDSATDPLSIFSIFKRYLENETVAADDAAVQLTKNINSLISNDSDVLEIAGKVSNLWGTLLFIAHQIPYDHSWQEKLVALIAAIRELPSPAHLDIESWQLRGYSPLWKGLPILGRAVYDSSSSQGLLHHRAEAPQGNTENEKVSSLYIPLSREEWVNFNAFQARVTTARLVDLSSSVEELFDHILGNGNTSSSKLNDNVPAIAVWVMYSGKAIHAGVWDDRKWTLAKERFAALARDEALHRNTRDWARGAYEEMSCIERDYRRL